MATVYLALIAGPAGFNKLLVVKVLRDDLMGGSEDAIRMFWNEARLSAQLVHSNIVHTFEVGDVDGRCFLAMEYLEGQTYRAVQNRAAALGGVPIHESLRILSEAARGLHYSHELKSFKGEPLGVVHRDVSPQNLMITYDGQVKVLDFGIAKMRDSDQLTQAGMIKGKLEYVAPEQLRGENLDGRADVFGLGAMLWEAISGERFAGGHKVPDVAKVHGRLTGRERKLRELKPDAPGQLVEIVERAIALDVNARFESAGAFANALDAYIQTLPIKPSASSLAAFLLPLFARERERMHQVINEQIERSRNGSEPLPRIDMDGASSSGLILGPAEVSSSGRSGSRKVVVRDTGDPEPPPSKQKRLTFFAIVGGAMALGAVLAIWSTEKDGPSQLAARTSSATQAPPAAVAAHAEPSARGVEQSAEKSVVLDVTVAPKNARVTLDGAPLTVPFHGRFQKSESQHIIEAAADGYQSFSRLIPFDTNQQVAIVLEANRQPTYVPAQASRRPVRAAGSDKRPPVTPEPIAELPRAPSAAPSAPAASPEVIEPGTKMTPGGSGGIRRKLIVADPYSTQ